MKPKLEKYKDEVITMRVDGYTCEQIAEEFNVSGTTVQNNLIKWGIYIGRKIKIPTETKIEMIRLYIECSYSCKTIGEIFGLNHDTIWQRLNEWGVDTSKPRYTSNGDFFADINTENKVYWLGLIGSDGNVRKNVLTISLQTRDREHLRKFLDDLDSDYKIYSLRGGKMSTIHVSNKQIITDLEKYGIVPNKTRILEPCRQILPHLTRHHWRGFIDGDGTTIGIYNNNPEIALCGTEAVCEAFKSWCLQFIDSKASVRKVENSYIYRLTGKYAVRIIKELYFDANIYLDRKYELAMEILNKYGHKIEFLI